jgi:signal transduction histidine kinase
MRWVFGPIYGGPVHDRMRRDWRHDRPHWTARSGRDGGSPGGRPKGAPSGVLAVVIAVVQIAGTRAAADNPAVELDALAYVLLGVSGLALGIRRCAPIAALVGAIVPTAVYFGLDYPFGPTFVAAIIATFHAMKKGRREAVWPIVFFSVIGYALWTFAGPGTDSWRQVGGVAIWSLVMLGFAEASRVRAAHIAEMAQVRAEQRRVKEEQERAEQEQQRRRASEERLRIARELHDVLGHHLSLINVQAGVGLHLMDDQPEQARAALTAIKHASAEALRETRAVLAALYPIDETAPRAPAPGLADLDALIADHNATGLPVTVEIEGGRAVLPAEVDRAAYRVVQEALTNVRRHAGAGAEASVRIQYQRNILTIRVADDGQGSTAVHASRPRPDRFAGGGLTGMRQRVEALGGEVRTGPRDGGGFEVCATLPLGEQ